MECDYTHLNHNSLVSPKKMVTKGMITKKVYFISTFPQCLGFRD
jgi:hypothetical protein